MTVQYTSKGAVLSPCERYRYRLHREWRGTHDPANWRWLGAKDGAGHELGEPKACVFIMLNPSTANGEPDDPTIRRCVGFARRWNFERLEVVNLFAYRATSPSDLLALNHNDDPVGVKNSEYVKEATFHAGLVVCAWGANGGHIGQNETVLGWVPEDTKLFALGRTKDGHPKHPLRLPYSTKLEQYR